MSASSVPYKRTLPPVAVSPFIRGCRYIALGTGILYGAFNYKRLSKKEARHREAVTQKWESEAPLREAKKKAAELENHLMMAKDFGIPMPPEFAKK